MSERRARGRNRFFGGVSTNPNHRIMNHLTLSRLFVPATLAAAALAQGPDFLVTYSQPEVTTSGSGGTPSLSRVSSTNFLCSSGM